MSDIQQTITNMTDSLHLGQLTLTIVLRFAVLVLVGIILIRILLKLVDRMLARSKALAPLRTYIRSVFKVLLWFLLALTAAASLNVDVTSLIALLSVAGLAVSLALQNTLSNVAGGIMVLVAKPFVVGDYVETEGVSGTVSGIDLAYCTFTTVDNKEIFIPNSQIAAAKIVNYNRLGRRQLELKFSASYDAPTQTVKTAIRQAMAQFPQIHADPAPVIWLSEFGDSSITYLTRMWVDAADYWPVCYGMQEAVRETFAAHGVEMTYNHLNVHLLKEG